MLADELTALIDRVIDDGTDPAEARLQKAHQRRSFAEALISRVAARHAVALDAMKRRHRSRSKHHVVMARAQACWLLHEAGYSYPEIARLLELSHHSQALRGKRQWDDKLAGLDKMVDEETARRALALIAKHGLTIAEAADWLEVSPLRLKGRIGTMRARENANG